MKKTLFLAILAGAALAGCVKNEEVAMSDTSPERIKFDAPVVSVPTRATEIADNFPKDRNFAVYALYHEGDFASYDPNTLYMNNVTCTAKESDGTDLETGDAPVYWAPATDYYWPKTEGAKLTFAAYSPAGMTTISANDTDKTKVGVKWNADGFTFQNYETSNPTTQEDLLYSGRVYNQTSADMLDIPGTAEPSKPANPYGGITIPFKHALSSIVFTARAETAGTVILTGIKVVNVYSKATFEQKLSYNSSTKADSETPQWSGYSSSLAECVVYPTKTDPTNTETELTTAPMTFTSDESATNGKRRCDLLVIPQKLSSADRTASNGYEVGTGGATDVKVIITYKIKNGEGWKEQMSEYKLASGSQDSPAYEWKINKRYTYNISIGLNKIYFNATVADFGTENTVLVK